MVHRLDCRVKRILSASRIRDYNKSQVRNPWFLPFPLLLAMVLFVDLFQLRIRYVGVNLGGGNVAVSE